MDMGQQRVCLEVQTTLEPKIKGRKEEAKERAKVNPKDLEEHSLVTSQHRNQNCGLKMIVLGGPKEYEERKAVQKVMKAFGRVEFELTRQIRVSKQ